MMKKMSIIISATFVILILLVPISIAQELSFTDDINDVLDAATGKKVSRPNIDIYKISCSKNGKVVELKLQLVSGGKIQNKLTIYYEIGLETDLNSYMAFYGGGEIGVVDENDNEIDVIENSGVGTDTLRISFNLTSPDEVCLNLSASTLEYSVETEEGYYDEYPNQIEIIEVDAGGPYTGTVGKPIQFYGNADYEGSNLKWSWDFGDGGTSELRNPKHTYNESGNYTVTLFVTVTDSEEIMGYDETTATIKEAETPSNGETKDSGYGLIVFIVLIIIVIIVGVAVVFFIRKK
ncbi:MAG: PKD domain-containing protein [Candidatus Thermoplasmatota archaeon]|jgi:uncharacterized membrane protein|nr:PKD domain-containing protein [Candidatus Thermoplasmatota archaeon]